MSELLFEPAIMLGVYASVIAVIVALLTRWTRLNRQRALAIVGAIAISLFVISIGIPYFFQGYAESNAVGADGTPLGWTGNPAIGLFAYLFTFKWTGFALLSTSLVCIALGSFSARIAVDAVAKSAVVLMACIMLTRLDAFASTINLVLE